MLAMYLASTTYQKPRLASTGAFLCFNKTPPLNVLTKLFTAAQVLYACPVRADIPCMRIQ